MLNENCQYISEVNSLDTENAESKTDTENVLVEFDSKELEVMTNLASIEKMFKSMEQNHTKLKNELLEIMKKHNLKSYENDDLKITYVPANVRESIDSAKLKSEFPDIAVKYKKTSNVKESIRITVK